MKGRDTQHYAYEATSDSLRRFRSLPSDQERMEELLLAMLSIKVSLDSVMEPVKTHLQEAHDAGVLQSRMGRWGVSLREWVALAFAGAAVALTAMNYGWPM